MIILQIAFSLATIVALSAGIPQLLKLIRLKSSAEFSLGTWAMWCVTQMTAVSYMITVGDPILILTNSLWCGFYVCMLVLILRYRPGVQRWFLFWQQAPVAVVAKPSTDLNQPINDDINKVY